MQAELYDKYGQLMDWIPNEYPLPDIVQVEQRVFARGTPDLRPAELPCAGSQLVLIYREVA